MKRQSSRHLLYNLNFPAPPELRLQFAILVSVDTTNADLVDQVRSIRHGSVEKTVGDEIQANLESLGYVRHASVTQPKDGLPMTIKFFPNDRENPPGKLADAEVHFTDGPLEGLKLMGFAVWERKNGARNVTFPSRQYSVNGERRSFALLRPRADAMSQDRLRDMILEAYKEYETALSEAV